LSLLLRDILNNANNALFWDVVKLLGNVDVRFEPNRRKARAIPTVTDIILDKFRPRLPANKNLLYYLLEGNQWAEVAEDFKNVLADVLLVRRWTTVRIFDILRELPLEYGQVGRLVGD
jgi:hypothetical protein